MAYFQTTIHTPASPEAAFAYLADFSNCRFWDESVPTARRLGQGPIERGERFEVTVELAGQRTLFDYELVELEPERLIVLRAETDRLRSLDTIRVEPSGRGSRVEYDADLRLKGLLHAFDAALHVGFQFVGRQAGEGLERALAALATRSDARRAGDRSAA